MWLVDTIYRAGSLTFEEIDSKWRDHEMTEKGLSKRTFHKWLNAIKTTFGLRIVCNNVGYRYSIENADEVKSRSLRGWLLDTVSVSNLFFDNMQLKDRILLEEIPSGKETLAEVLAAMKTDSVVTIMAVFTVADGVGAVILESYYITNECTILCERLDVCDVVAGETDLV